MAVAIVPRLLGIRHLVIGEFRCAVAQATAAEFIWRAPLIDCTQMALVCAQQASASSPRRDALDDLAVGVEELDARGAVSVHFQRQAIAPSRVGKHDAGNAVARLADE